MSVTQNEVIASLAGAGISGAAVIATYYGCKYIYKKINQLPAYSKDELRRHNQLVGLYCRIFDLPEPAEWKLADDGLRPSYKFDLTAFADTLDINMIGLRIPSAPIRQSVCGILSTISQLLANMADRWLNSTSGSSVEVLFFTEIARLMLAKFPTLSFEKEESMRELRKILYFCKEMKPLIPPEGKIFGVLTPNPRNNPTDGLRDIILNLNSVIESAEALNKAATFVRRIEALDNAVTSMIGDSFNILTLLIDGNHDHESILPVSVFLNKEQIHRPDLIVFKMKRMAMWIEQTLNAAGIKNTSFSGTKRLTLAEADIHLAGECSTDSRCILPKKLLDIKHKDWGHWPFSTDDIDVKKIEARLINIREVLRNVLKIHHLHTLLTNARKVAPTAGEAWLYGDTTGIAIVTTLMDVAEELTLQMYRSLIGFMEDYEHIFENKKSKPGGLLVTCHGYIATNKAISQVEGVAGSAGTSIAFGVASGSAGIPGAEKTGGFKEHYRQAVEEIAAIKVHCAGYNGRETEIEESKRQLLDDLLGYLEYKGRKGEGIYRALKLASDIPLATVVANSHTVKPETGMVDVDVVKVDYVGEAKADAVVAKAAAIRATADAEAVSAAAERITAMIALQGSATRETVTRRVRAPFTMFGTWCCGDVSQVIDPAALPASESMPTSSGTR